MKFIQYILLFSIGIFSLNTFAAKKEKESSEGKYHLEFKVKGLEEDSMLIIANYYGLKQYYYDTAFATTKGTFVLEKDSIPGGIYLVVMPDKAGYFEVIVSGKEKSIIMETNLANLVEDMKVSESFENDLFYYFQKQMAVKSMMAMPIQDKIEKYKADSTGNSDDSLKMAQDELTTLNGEVVAFKKKFIAENEGTFVSKIFKTSEEPEVPENDQLKGDELQEWKYQYFKTNYLKDVDFTDERLLRTPVLGKKIDYYIQKLTLQIPDSVNAAADMMANRSKTNKEVYKYVVHYITNTYERSKIMGMDAVFVHQAENHYCTDEGAWWIDSAATAKICDRAKTLSPLLIGKKAQNIILVDTTETTWHNLHKIPAELTIVVFWSPTCGHCKKAIPQLEKEVHQVYKDQGVFVYGVCTELEMPNMKTFIKQKGLTFLNVSDTKEINENAYKYMADGKTTLNSLNFRSIWDIFSTPQVYVLNEDKEIIAKKLGIEQLPDFIKDYKKMQKEIAEEELKSSN